MSILFKKIKRKNIQHTNINYVAFILDWITTIEFTFFLIRFWSEIDKWFEAWAKLKSFYRFIFWNSYLFSLLTCIDAYFIFQIFQLAFFRTPTNFVKVTAFWYTEVVITTILGNVVTHFNEENIQTGNLIYVFNKCIYSCHLSVM